MSSTTVLSTNSTYIIFVFGQTTVRVAFYTLIIINVFINTENNFLLSIKALL